MASKELPLVAEMLRRQHDRQEQRQNVHAERAKNNERCENLDYFLDTFAGLASDIAQSIDSLQRPGDTTIPIRLNTISQKVQQMQAYLSTSTMFLPVSVVNRSQNEIVELNRQLLAVRTALVPKKKFGFKSKPEAAMTSDDDVAGTADTAAKSEPDNCSRTMVPVAIAWTCQNQRGREILLEDDAVNGKDLTFSTLSHCVVRICGHPGSLHMSNVRNSLIVCGPVARSVFVDNCVDSVLAFGCQQFRLHSSSRLAIYMHVTCRAIVEDCTAIAVAPFTFTYDGIEVDFVKAGLDVEQNNWRDVADFNWLAVDQVSPNWNVMPQKDWERNWSGRLDEFRRSELTEAVELD